MAVEAVDTIGGQHMPLRDQVLVALRQRIVNGDYPPGERLTEDRLAADFGVSRNPVREALRVVQTEGFVVMVPRRGAFVALPTKPAVTTTSTEPCQEGGVPRRPPPTAGCEHEGEDEVLERRSRCGEQREGEPGIGCTAGDGVDAPGA